jgi:hypothetical protein
MSNNELMGLRSSNLPEMMDVNAKIDEFISELGLKVGNTSDKYEIANILLNHLSYPRSDLAEKHHNANKLGEVDLKEKKGEQPMNQTIIRVKH